MLSNKVNKNKESLFWNKNDNSPKSMDISSGINIKDVIEKIKHEVLSDTRYNKKSIRLRLITSVNTNDDVIDKSKRTATKFGGAPFWPKSKPWPTHNGDNMQMYAQINFSETPHLDGYPTSGIMQIFVLDTEYDKDMSAKVVYHSKIDDNVELIDVFPKLSSDSDDYVLNDKVYYLKGNIEMSCIHPGLDDFYDVLIPLLNRYLHTDYGKYSDIPRQISDLIYDCFQNVGGSRIGGFPYFTQFDARDNKYPEMLLQMDSEYGMMWGDSGVANFFGNVSDITSNEPRDIYFTWDCC